MATTRVRNVNPPFYEIIGHDHIKKFFHMALITDELTHILLTGLPASAKTKFLLSLKKDLKYAYFIDGWNTTKAGIIDYFGQISAAFTH
jgi:Holliday junction DNA helicase RuvB